MARKHRKRRKSSLGRTILIALIGLALLLALAMGYGALSDERSAAPAVTMAAVSAEPTATAIPTPTPVPPTAVPMSTVEPFSTIAPTPEPERVDYEYPYLIVVNYKAQLVRIYTLDENGMYNTVVKNMITSSGAKRFLSCSL